MFIYTKQLHTNSTRRMSRKVHTRGELLFYPFDLLWIVFFLWWMRTAFKDFKTWIQRFRILLATSTCLWIWRTRAQSFPITYHTQETNEGLYLGWESLPRKRRCNSCSHSYLTAPSSTRPGLCSATPSSTTEALSRLTVSHNPLESTLGWAAGPHPLSFWFSKPGRQEDDQFA